MEKLASFFVTAVIFIVFFAISGEWEVYLAVRIIFSALLAAIFYYLFFKPKNNKNESK